MLVSVDLFLSCKSVLMGSTNTKLLDTRMWLSVSDQVMNKTTTYKAEQWGTSGHI